MWWKAPVFNPWGFENADISTTQGTLQAVDDFELASQTLIPLGDKWEPLANA